MRTSSQLFLTFLFNALWMIPLVAAAASLASWLLRETSARYRHWVWTVALFLAIAVPAIATANGAFSEQLTSNQPAFSQFTTANLQSNEYPLPRTLSVTNESPSSSVNVSPYLALAVLLIYLAVFAFSVIRLARAWILTRQIKRSASLLVGDELTQKVIENCVYGLQTQRNGIEVLTSSFVDVPVTIGLIRPVIILPAQLLDEANIELLTSAIGHELIHVARRDYVLNLVYELLFIPLAFHPAAALIRRRIRQTRELCCDELVAERILKPEIYARSLVQLAGSAPPLRRLSISTTVGIADADILEARIMSLLRKPKLDARWKKMLLIAVSLLLVVPCVAVAAFAMRFEVQPAGALFAQDPQEKEKEDREKKELKEKRERESREYREGWEAGEKQATGVYTFSMDPKERERRQEEEMKERSVRQAALVKLARVQMDQAIQIATSQQPGKVLECTLNGEHWEEPGKLAKDGVVFYHVVIMSGDEANPVVTHVLVNAIEGNVMKAEQELPRKERRSERP